MRKKKVENTIELIKVNNLKKVFSDIRDYVAGNATGITRDETIAQNLLLILFCKLYDEKYNIPYRFFVKDEDTLVEIKYNINLLLEEAKNKYNDIFEKKDKITIDGKTLKYIVQKLEYYDLANSARDVIADAFEELIGTSFRGGEGQFFTPRNIVEMMISILKPKVGENVMEPACGSGGFLAYILRDYQNTSADSYKLNGIEKDKFLSKIAKMYLSILGATNYYIGCENSLDVPESWSKETNSNICLNDYNLILTNPPFGAKIPIIDKKILSQYELGHVWKKKNGKWIKTENLHDKQPPQILFIERIIQFLKEGGRAGIVLPDGIFGNPSDRYIWEYINQNCKIIGVVSLAHETFQPSTHTKTSVLFIEKTKVENDYEIFMATAKTIGHNKNGKEIYLINNNGDFILDKQGNKILDDDIPEITKNFNDFLNRKFKNNSSKGFVIKKSEISNDVYIPEHYFNEDTFEENKLNKKYDLYDVKTLIDKGYIKISRGNEIGSRFYGTGNVPFVRTTDIVNWEIKANTVKAVAEEVYNKYSLKQNIKENDILFVNDGTFLIGRSAYVTECDKKIIIQSHLRKITVNKNDLFDSYYLMYLLNTKYVQKQIKKKIFTQATLSTLGNRLEEVKLPISKDKKVRQSISKNVKSIIDQKINNKKSIEKLMSEEI